MVDYSKWKTIELSSDEDEVHPFIENSTLFRLRHEARLRKMEQRRQEEFAFECQRASYLNRLKKVKNSIAEDENNDELTQQMNELKIEEKQLKDKEEKLNKQMLAWYIDTICKPGFSKAQINKTDETSEDLSMFIKSNEKSLQNFGNLKSFDETKNFLMFHPQLICRNTLYYLISFAMELYLQRDKDRLKNVSRQIVCLENLLEVFKEVPKNRKEILISFFQSIKLADDEMKTNFKREYAKVEKLVKELAEEHLKEECETQSVTNDDHTYALNAEEVLKTLPEDMRCCFINSDKEALTQVLNKMSKDLAEYHMKRCIESGLWVPSS